MEQGPRVGSQLGNVRRIATSRPAVKAWEQHYRPSCQHCLRDGHLSGRHRVQVVGPQSTCVQVVGPQATCVQVVGPQSTCVQVVGPQSVCVQVVGPQSTCVQVVGPQSACVQVVGPQSTCVQVGVHSLPVYR